MALSESKRFTLMAFPQFFDGTSLALNIALLPRNQNPLSPAIEADPVIPDAPAFADALPQFQAQILNGSDQFPAQFPGSALTLITQALSTTAPTQSRALFEALAAQLQISPTDTKNTSLAANSDKSNDPLPPEQSVFKYLPVSYRSAFNFITPRSPNAKTDDSYLCALRHSTNSPAFPTRSDQVSWGAVFAYAMRQPALAQQLGMMYQTTVTITPDLLLKGGWLWVDFAPGTPFSAQQVIDGTFTDQYAARIPALDPAKPRQVFAPLMIPVLTKQFAADPDPVVHGDYDQVLLDLADYDDGFAKVVHTFQPISMNHLAETSDGAHPVHDAGIRLGWDDEQILDWYVRQLSIDPSVILTPPIPSRLDAPLGVFGYSIDVSQHQPGGAPVWNSLTHVTSRSNLVLKAAGAADPPLTLGSFDGELPYQVYPARPGGDPTGPFWLPMYFANWNGSSMVLPDDTAAAVFGTTSADANSFTRADGPAANALSKIYQAAPIGVSLRYGNTYDFRVRMRDLTGGGPKNDPGVVPTHQEPAQIGSCAFKRYVAPNQIRVDLKALANGNPASDVPSSPDSLQLTRPLLNYPAVVYTGGYTDPIGKLTAASLSLRGVEAFGIPDPDVATVEISVEVAALRMDNQLSLNGSESYALLYQTRRSFPAAANDNDFALPLTLPITYRDCKVLHFGPTADLVADLGLPGPIDGLTEIVLPTARTIRITLRAICGDKPDNAQYFGLLSNSDPALDTRFGHILQFTVARASLDETALFLSNAPAEIMRGLYLQPNPPLVLDGDPTSLLLGNSNQPPQSLAQRLASETGLNASGLTLSGKPGERVQFGCSNRIRHTLSPDHASLTFSTEADLMHHWLCCIDLELNRDWTWDSLADRSFTLSRTRHFTHSADAPVSDDIGTIELRHTAPFDSLREAQRTFTRLVFIDAVEPKIEDAAPDSKPETYPDGIDVSYSIQPVFKPGLSPAADGPLSLSLSLPITVSPAQTPVIASVGLALSPYLRTADYSSSQPRQRFLWVEFQEPVRDPQDLYFARVLAYAPDQLLSNNELELFIAPDIPPIPLDPELTRVIGPGATDDLAGLDAMQPMEKASDSELHYLLPLPPGLHADSPEMFGFFTYEFRVGHARRQPDNISSWTTAQGRFGRPLVVTGIQHPAPSLTCIASHDEEKLYVSAPFATAVHDGRNMTAAPPRTQLWCMLYAQVRQADGADFRNLLLDERMLDWRVRVQPPQTGLASGILPPATPLSAAQVTRLAALEQVTWKSSILDATMAGVLQLTEVGQANRDATLIGTAIWSQQQVAQLLTQYGLPKGASLSVLVVEKLPSIQNAVDFLGRTTRGTNGQGAGVVQDARLSSQLSQFGLNVDRAVLPAGGDPGFSAIADLPSPFGDELGQHRILRTSPLTAVPFACCC